MANTNYQFLDNTGLNENNSLKHLMQSISPDEENEVDLLEHSAYYSNTEFISMYQKTENEVTILNLNCCSLNARIDDLKIFLAMIDVKFNVISLQETWCDESCDMDNFIIPGYAMIIKPKSAEVSNHGGLIIYIDDDFNYSEIPGNGSLIHESLGIEIWRKESKITTKYTIFSIYRVPTGLLPDLQLFIDKFTELLELYQHKNAYFCCDTNINLLEINTKPHFNTFYEDTTQLGFLPKITLPTRLGANTLIDNIFTNNVESEHISGIFQHKLSDHQAIFCIIKGKGFKHRKLGYIEVESVNQKTLNAFKNELVKQEVYGKLNTNDQTDPNHNCNILINTLVSIKNKHIPKKVRKFNTRKDKIQKWMTTELLELVNKKNDLYIDWKSNSESMEIYNIKKIHFRAYEHIVNREKNEIKRKYYYDTFEAQKKSMKKTWRTINDTLNRHKQQHDMPSEFNHNGDTLKESNEIATAFNNFFVNIGSDLASNISANDNVSYAQYLNTPTHHTCTFEPVNHEEVLTIINKLDNKSSSGVYGISNILLKFIKMEIIGPLTLIINQMLYTGIFPEKLKIAKIIPIYKKGDSSILSNYRPISLLPTISKIFERVIYNQLYRYFNHNNLLSEEQYGFRAEHSTELAAIKLVDYIMHQMDDCKIPVNIYLDLSKAFDTLDFDILLHKLNYYGVADKSNNLIKTYLTNRQQCVKFENSISKYAFIKTGVPQGSILGPLLFSIYINDLVKIGNKFKYIMYADDTTLYFNLEDFEQTNLEANIMMELDKVNVWLSVNKLSLNIKKTKLMIFHTRQRHIKPISLTLNNVDIERVPSFNFLGIHLDENINWKCHVDMLTNKLSKIMGILNRLKHIYPQQVLLTLYNTLFISHINYGLLLWGTHIERVEKVQKKVIRIITYSSYTAHTEPLFKMLELLKLKDIFHHKILKFYYNMTHGKLPPYFNKYISYISHSDNDDPLPYHYRSNVRPLIKTVIPKHKFAEAGMLCQLVKLLNTVHKMFPLILTKIDEKSHSYYGFSFNVKRIMLEMYTYECNLAVCYQCGRP